MPARTVKPRRPLTPVGVLERRLGAVLHAELREEMLHVELHRVVGQAEPLGDLRVGEPAGDQRPDLALARSEVSAICGLVSPPATSAQTSRSRGVRSPGALARPSIQRRAACGNTSWPACTCRIAVNVCWGDSVFNARPSAPASSAERSDSPSL